MSMRVTPSRRIRPWRNKMGGYIGTGNRRAMKGLNSADRLQALFDAAPLAIPLTHSLTPTQGTATATFTRALAATVTDHEGVLRTALSGEARFQGARRVRNLLTYTEDFSNAAWTKINGGTGTVPTVTSGFTDPNGGTGAWRLQCDSGGGTGAGDFSIVRQSVATGGFIGRLDHIWMKSNTGATQYIYWGSPSNGRQETITTTWTQYSLVSIGTSTNFDIGSYPAGTTTNLLGTDTQVVDILIWHPQMEDIRGRADQTTPSEYVSVGVLSAPYHGANVDGVKYFSTDINGSPIPSSTLQRLLVEPAATNYCLQSNALGTTWTDTGTPAAAQNTVGPNGTANYAWTLTDDAAGAFEGITQNNVAFTAGQTGCFSVLVKKKASSPAYPVLQLTHNVTAGTFTALVINEVAGTVAGIATGGNYVAPVASGCRSLNDNYWLVWVAGTQAGASALATLQIFPAGSTDGTTLSVAGTGATVFCDVQFEIGSTPSSRITTTVAAVTRPADVLTYTDGDIANFKSLACSFRRETGVSALGYALALSDNTANEYISVSLTSATALKFDGVDGGVPQLATTASNAYTPAATGKASISLTANNILMAFNGTGQTADDSATLPTVTQLQVAHLNGASQLNGNVSGIYGWTRATSQSEVTAVTA